MTDANPPRPIYFPMDDREAWRPGEDEDSDDERVVFDEDGDALPNHDRPTPVTG